jgi:RsiW-degrading membrane proteinase PrsW (M82 family)
MNLNIQSRVLYGSPLSRPKVAKFVVIALAVLVVLATVSLVRNIFAPLSPDALQIFLIGLAGTLIMTLFPLAILWFLDRREPESLWLYLIALLWGALIAVGLALPLSGTIFQSVDRFLLLYPSIQEILGPEARTALSAPLAGPIVEETIKGIGVLLLFWILRSEFDGVRDGFIYGALIGIGFNITEAPLYVVYGYLQEGTVPLYLQMADRFALFGFAGHALYTGLFGMGLGLARQTTRRWLRYAAPVGSWLLGFSAHFLNNALALLVVLFFYLAGKPIPTESAEEAAEVVPEVVQPFLSQWVQHSTWRLVGFLPLFVLVAVMLWQSGIWERQVIRDGLADETEPVITPDEYEAVKGDRIFRTRHIAGLDRKTSAAIVKAQNELAIRKWRVKHDGKSVEADPLVSSWRAELLRLRQNLPTLA